MGFKSVSDQPAAVSCKNTTMWIYITKEHKVNECKQKKKDWITRKVNIVSNFYSVKNFLNQFGSHVQCTCTYIPLFISDYDDKYMYMYEAMKKNMNKTGFETFQTTKTKSHHKNTS